MAIPNPTTIPLRRSAAAGLKRMYTIIHMKKTTNDLRLGLSALACLIALLLSSSAPLLAQNVRGGSVGDPTALLDLQSTSKGLLLPRMSSAERSAIVNPAEGLLIYNTNLGCIELNIGSSASPKWGCILAMNGRIAGIDCGAAVLSDSLIVATTNRVDVTIPYTGGNGSFYTGQAVASTGVTGLTAELLSGAFANGSGSLTYTITGVPSAKGTASFALSVGGQTCTLSLPVSGCGAFVGIGQWKEFMCHNLGANTSADPFLPGWELIGNYYQWGRNPGCFGRDGIDGSNPCSSPVYGAAGPWGATTADDNAGGIAGWGPDAPDGAWLDDVKTANDPCPAGFRVPTKVQWDGLANESINPPVFFGTWADMSNNYSSGIRFGNALFLPAAGQRSFGGSLIYRASYGAYWSSTVSGTSAREFRMTPQDTYTFFVSARSFGNLIRCVAE